MGAGRLFALGFLLAARPCAAALPASALAQATAVGPYAALTQGSGVELRDAYNRPISRGALADELRGGARAEAQDAAAVSRLAGARALLEFVERHAGLAAALRGDAARRQAVSALRAVTRRVPKAEKAFVSVRLGAPAPGGTRVAAGPAHASAPDRALVLPLRL